MKLLRPIANHVHTMTYDNGKEFAYHEAISEALGASGYFAHPYHSWERGLNENMNGLIRQYLPKKSDFNSLTQQTIKAIMNKLNNRPKKCPGFKTPNQVFFGINPPVAPGACPRIESLLRKSHFGPFSRSFSLNMNSYSPQMIEKMDSKWHSLATTSILGQPLGELNPRTLSIFFRHLTKIEYPVVSCRCTSWFHQDNYPMGKLTNHLQDVR